MRVLSLTIDKDFEKSNYGIRDGIVPIINYKVEQK
jgi:hypothetical protein